VQIALGAAERCRDLVDAEIGIAQMLADEVLRAESLQASIFGRKPRSCKSSFGTITTSCRVKDGLIMVCGEDTS
jgi:hypothetical protein